MSEPHDSLFERLTRGLAGRYRVGRELGGGGMSRVFLAEEVALGRQVVLKVFPPEIARVLSADRFTREVRLAAMLQHPHIVPLLAAGEADGLLYYTMPLVEGESLRAKLAREGALPIAEAVRLLRDTADALAGAHAHGVIHRDIKPDNILVSQGHAVVADFGIAKALTEAGGPDAVTGTGIVLGTPAYMAPEQASADPRLDHRADLYALGVVAYEVLTGEPPFAGATAQAVIAAHVTRPARPISEVRASVPAPLASLAMRLLEKQPADRVQTAREVLAELDATATTGGLAPVPPPARRWPVGHVLGLYALASAALWGVAGVARTQVGLPDWFMPSVLTLLALGLPVMLITAVLHNRRTLSPHITLAGAHHAVFTWRRALGGGIAAMAGLGLVTLGYLVLRAAGIGPVGTLIASGRMAEREPILVADFVNRTPDSLLGDVVTQAIRIDLAQSRSLELVPVDYVRQVLRLMARPPVSKMDVELAREVAARGRIKAVLTGEIQPAGAGFMISAQLLTADSAEVLVAHRELAKDSSRILDAVGAVSRRLRERVGESLRSLGTAPALAEVTTPSLDALRKYTSALRANEAGRDDQGVRLLEEAVAIDTGFAMAWRKLGTMLSNLRVDRGRQVAAITHAYQQRGRLTERERRLTESSYYSLVRGREDSAIVSMERLLDTWPNDGWALNNMGVYRGNLGDHRSAISYYRRATLAEPLNGLAWGNLITTFITARMPDSAEAAASEFERTIPNHVDLPRVRVALPLARLDFDSGERLLRERLENTGSDERARARWSAILAGVHQHRGRLREADRTLAALEAGWRQVGQLDGAVEALARRVYLQARYSPHSERAAALLAEGETRLGLTSSPPPSFQRWQLAIAAARAGEIDKAERYLAQARRQLEEAPSRGLRMLLAWAQAELAEASGRGIEEALDSVRAYAAVACRECPHGALAGLFDGLGQRDSALAHYQEFADSYPAGWFRGFYRIDLPDVYYRLGELYEWKGERARALEFYQKFADLWKDADPELQPRVREARRRVAALAGEPRS